MSAKLVDGVNCLDRCMCGHESSTIDEFRLQHDRLIAKFSKSRVWGHISRGKLAALVFRDTQFFSGGSRGVTRVSRNPPFCLGALF